MSVSPGFLPPGNAAILATGTDGRLWAAYFPPMSGAAVSFFAQNPIGTDSLSQIGGQVPGFSIVNTKTVGRWSDGQLHIYITGFNPGGSNFLFGLHSITPIVVTAENTLAGPSIKCTNYTVNGGKTPLTQFLPSLSPSYDGDYYIGTSTASNNNVVTTSSTIFKFAGQTDVAKKTCELTPVVSLDHEIVQAMKVSPDKFLIERTIKADTLNPITEGGELAINGTYTALVGSSQFTTCCLVIMDWTNKRAVFAGTGIDGSSRAILYPDMREVFSSKTNGQLAVAIRYGDLKGNHLTLSGSGGIAFSDQLVAVNTDTGMSTVIANYNNDTSAPLPNVSPPLLCCASAISPDGTVYLEVEQLADKALHIFKTTVPGFTVPPAPTFTNVVASPSSINSGMAATLTWATQNATSVTISPAIGMVPASGTVNIAPAQTTTYTLTATGPGGTATVSVLVTVAVAPPTVSAVVNGGSFKLGPVAPGSL
ncbi:MAG: hypothetical protein KGJ13_08135, partial [Patescibacteria group bacterium]|nr:hypothetical protein [Patescibacteria group bacterium]